ncbi:MAG TPA: hypothetical protein ENK41_05695 [Rhodobacteraceae bacterium]|nr:hypothetical protein [Paracoccaceae bacterium]
MKWLNCFVAPLCAVIVITDPSLPLVSSPGNTGARAGFDSHPRWWSRDLRRLQVRCTLDRQIPAIVRRSVCREVAGIIKAKTGGRIPVRVAPALNAGLTDAGSATLFFNVGARRQGQQLILAASLVIYRLDLASQLTTGLHGQPRISIVANRKSVAAIRQSIKTTFSSLFASL